MERLCITVGDPSGIGLEVILKSLSSTEISGHALILAGSVETIEEGSRRLGMKPDIKAVVESPQDAESPGCYVLGGLVPAVGSGSKDEREARAAVSAIEKATEHCMNARCSAMITAPVSKARIAATIVGFTGQTEFIGKLVGAKEPTMMMASNELRVALLTTHEPIARVAGMLTKERIIAKLRVIHHDLKSSWLIRSPRLAVLGLNPHAGESGLIGGEEEDIFAPAMAEVKQDGMDVSGPLSPDAFFSRETYRNFDAVISPYHDQGLVPFKLLSKGRGVNVTLGLPIVRTSPEHGTAFDIAGRGLADPTSMINAIKLAAELSRNRRGSG
jgi:4-hydroxythreonine-4-phosphate dehydrogenase